MPNEKTSKRVASAASDVMNEADDMIEALFESRAAITDAIRLLRKAKRASASALTQHEK